MTTLSSIYEVEAIASTRLAASQVVHSGSNMEDGAALEDTYRRVRRCTEALCEPLASEDYVVQSMPDASPVKWHLAHTTWFFETFLLVPYLPGYRPFHPQFQFLFNSYYQSVGARWPRSQRGLLSRPTVVEVFGYRAYVDKHMAQLLRMAGTETAGKIAATVLLGVQHEQQHQELILTDLKHAWAANPLRPVYREVSVDEGIPPPGSWLAFPRDWPGSGTKEVASRSTTNYAPPDLAERL